MYLILLLTLYPMVIYLILRKSSRYRFWMRILHSLRITALISPKSINTVMWDLKFLLLLPLLVILVIWTLVCRLVLFLVPVTCPLRQKIASRTVSVFDAGKSYYWREYRKNHS